MAGLTRKGAVCKVCNGTNDGSKSCCKGPTIAPAGAGGAGLDAAVDAYTNAGESPVVAELREAAAESTRLREQLEADLVATRAETAQLKAAADRLEAENTRLLAEIDQTRAELADITRTLRYGVEPQSDPVGAVADARTYDEFAAAMSDARKADGDGSMAWTSDFDEAFINYGTLNVAVRCSDLEQAENLLRYWAQSQGRGVEVVWSDESVPGVIQVAMDLTKSRSDDLGARITSDPADFICTGTPIRRTDRAGTGTKGTRAVDAIVEDDMMIAYGYYA